MYSLLGTFVHIFVLVGLQPCLEFVVATLFSLGVICFLGGVIRSINCLFDAMMCHSFDKLSV